MEIAGSAALVTGAASGLGAATAAALAARGASVYGLDLEKSLAGATAPDGRDTAAGRRHRGGRGACGAGPDRRRRAAAAARGQLRGHRAGGADLSRRGPHDLDLFRTVVGVNLVGTFNVVRLAAAAMSRLPADADGQRGVVDQHGLDRGVRGAGRPGGVRGVEGGGRRHDGDAARDLAQHGIRVIAIAPGIVDTPMMAGMPDEVRAGLAASVPFPQRLARPEEYARLVLMIAAHDYLNGETIRMDGALRMGPR